MAKKSKPKIADASRRIGKSAELAIGWLRHLAVRNRTVSRLADFLLWVIYSTVTLDRHELTSIRIPLNDDLASQPYTRAMPRPGRHSLDAPRCKSGYDGLPDYGAHKARGFSSREAARLSDEYEELLVKAGLLGQSAAADLRNAFAGVRLELLRAQAALRG